MTNCSKQQQIQNILSKAQSLRGYTLEQLSQYLHIKSPKSLIHAKGLTGQILEVLLGAHAGSKPIPDFPDLNLEVKTIPMDLMGNPLETTYVCTVPLLPKIQLNHKTDYFNFYNSVVYKKLSHVLWVPILCPNKTEKNQTINQVHRIIGSAYLWQPSQRELGQLESDWLELTDMVYMGKVDQISSHYGQVLQIRPKAADSSKTTLGIGPTGQKINTLPRGFYLRTEFTRQIYNQNNTDDILHKI